MPVEASGKLTERKKKSNWKISHKAADSCGRWTELVEALEGQRVRRSVMELDF
jgi:hypothetical protein